MTKAGTAAPPAASVSLAYLWNRLVTRRRLIASLARHALGPGCYRVDGGEGAPSAVHFDLGDVRYVHLGDQLFYEPVMRWLQAAGVPVTVSPTPALAAYFEAVGLPVVPAAVGASTTLRVVPLASFDPDDRGRGPQLVVDFAEPRIREPLPVALLHAVERALGRAVPSPPIDRSCDLATVPRVALPRGAVIFSNYVDSGRFRIRASFHRALRAQAERLRSDGHSIVHVGSARDKALDPLAHDFVDVDLRGKTSPLALLAAFHDAESTAAVTFDNFVMHACLMAGKPAFVKFRGRFSESARLHHYRNVNTALAATPDLVTYL